MKKLSSALMAIVMMVLILPSGMKTASAEQDGDFIYAVAGSETTITAYTGAGGNVIVPGLLGEHPVTGIGDFAFSQHPEIDSVILPDSLKKIGYSAFSACTAITSLNIPTGTAEIGDKAFAFCLGLTAVNIPDSVTIIGDYAFFLCTGLVIFCSDSSYAHIFASNKLIEHEVVFISFLPDIPGCSIDYVNRLIFGFTDEAAFSADCFYVAQGYSLVCAPSSNGYGTGTVVQVMQQAAVVKSYIVVVFGDVNGDGNTDSADAGIIVDVENFAVSWDAVADAAKYIAADVNKDRNIDSSDAGAIVDDENYSFIICDQNFSQPAPARDKVKNVIFIIGDGMGENHLMLTKQELGITLVMETILLHGQSETRSSNNTVTDSAAGATALACGVRTLNDAVGVYPDDINRVNGYPMNLTEFAHQTGMKTGIVTTDLTTGATPAGFSAHSSSRSNTRDIALQEIASGIDLFWGAADSETAKASVEANGYHYITTLSEMNVLTQGEKSFGQFNGSYLWQSVSTNNTPTLTQMAGKAISQLNGGKGFFLMIEGAHIDKFSHSRDVVNTVACVRELDRVVQTALEFAQADGNTLVIVTADHETGAVKFSGGKYVFTSGSHSGVNVPLFIYGSLTFIQNGQAIKNSDVAARTALAMGFTSREFPYKYPNVPSQAAA